MSTYGHHILGSQWHVAHWYLKTLMPCPFTGLKMFLGGPNFLCQIKNSLTYCDSHKDFGPAKKMIYIQ